jgi:hypothetical protein
MNDPKRLVAESRSMLAHELLSAAQSERVPDALRQRMVEGFAVTLGVGSIGAGFALSGSAQAGVQGGFAAAQSAGVAAGEAGFANAVGFGATATGATATGATATAGGGAALAQGATWASSAVWLKGVIAVCAVTGAVGLGSVVKRWAEPNAVSDGTALQAGSLVVSEPVAPHVLDPNAAHRVASEGDAVDPGSQAIGGGEGKAVRRSTRKSKLAASEHGSIKDVSGDLGREVRMLDAARRAIIAGDIGIAREKLAQYSRAFPQGSLRAEAASLAKAAASAQ